jgi:hypothetical protein
MKSWDGLASETGKSDMAAVRGSGSTHDDACDRVRFFTIADSGYFLGLVGLVNSLRLQGHEELVTVIDLGLAADQRAVLQTECEFVKPPSDVHRHAWLLEPYACMVRRAKTVVYVDSDIIITAPLDEILVSADSGRICVFGNVPHTRWFSQWEQIFSLPCAPRKQTYINAGFLAFSPACFPQLLSRWWECCDLLVGQPTVLDTNNQDSPTALSSQDAINAILMSEVALDRIDFQPAGAEAQGPVQLRNTRVVDITTLECQLEGQQTTLLHAWGVPKPWDPDADGLRHSAYLRCLRRLVVSQDLAVRLPPDGVAAWLQPGLRGALAFWLHSQARRSRRNAKARIRRAVGRLGAPRDLDSERSAGLAETTSRRDPFRS